MSQKRKRQPGSKPKRLKAEGVDWKDTLKHALGKPKPKSGWQKSDQKADE